MATNRNIATLLEDPFTSPAEDNFVGNEDQKKQDNDDSKREADIDFSELKSSIRIATGFSLQVRPTSSATSRDGVSQGENRDSPLESPSARIHFEQAIEIPEHQGNENIAQRLDSFPATPSKLTADISAAANPFKPTGLPDDIQLFSLEDFDLNELPTQRPEITQDVASAIFMCALLQFYRSRQAQSGNSQDATVDSNPSEDSESKSRTVADKEVKPERNSHESEREISSLLKNIFTALKETESADVGTAWQTFKKTLEDKADAVINEQKTPGPASADLAWQTFLKTGFDELAAAFYVLPNRIRTQVAQKLLQSKELNEETKEETKNAVTYVLNFHLARLLTEATNRHKTFKTKYNKDTQKPKEQDWNGFLNQIDQDAFQKIHFGLIRYEDVKKAVGKYTAAKNKAAKDRIIAVFNRRANLTKEELEGLRKYASSSLGWFFIALKMLATVFLDYAFLYGFSTLILGFNPSSPHFAVWILLATFPILIGAGFATWRSRAKKIRLQVDSWFSIDPFEPESSEENEKANKNKKDTRWVSAWWFNTWWCKTLVFGFVGLAGLAAAVPSCYGVAHGANKILGLSIHNGGLIAIGYAFTVAAFVSFICFYGFNIFETISDTRERLKKGLSFAIRAGIFAILLGGITYFTIQGGLHSFFNFNIGGIPSNIFWPLMGTLFVCTLAVSFFSVVQYTARVITSKKDSIKQNKNGSTQFIFGQLPNERSEQNGSQMRAQASYDLQKDKVPKIAMTVADNLCYAVPGGILGGNLIAKDIGIGLPYVALNKHAHYSFIKGNSSYLFLTIALMLGVILVNLAVSIGFTHMANTWERKYKENKGSDKGGSALFSRNAGERGSDGSLASSMTNTSMTPRRPSIDG